MVATMELNATIFVVQLCLRPRFHRDVKHTTPGTEDSINDENASPIHRCNVCLVLDAGSTLRNNKKRLFPIYFQSNSLRNNSNNLL